MVFAGCSGNDDGNAPAPDASQGTYFSLGQFAQSQFEAYWGQPFTLERIIVLNGKKDSALISSFKIDWASILKVFMDADISDPKFLDRYSFSSFADAATDSKTFYYEAKEPGLYTRTLQITADRETENVRAIYIETSKKSGMGSKNQKLYYAPVKIIQIQEHEDHAVGRDNDLRIEYRFLY
jgi:hypothetical protein